MAEKISASSSVVPKITRTPVAVSPHSWGPGIPAVRLAVSVTQKHTHKHTQSLLLYYVEKLILHTQTHPTKTHTHTLILYGFSALIALLSFLFSSIYHPSILPDNFFKKDLGVAVTLSVQVVFGPAETNCTSWKCAESDWTRPNHTGVKTLLECKQRPYATNSTTAEIIFHRLQGIKAIHRGFTRVLGNLHPN